MKLAVISDLHFSIEDNMENPSRVGRYADVLLERAVRRLNEFIKPDLVFIGGDLVNDPDFDKNVELMHQLKAIIDKLQAPVIVIPGNHDSAPEKFYTIFDRPEEFVDVGGIRFLPFPDDQEEPGYNASRSLEKIAAMRQLAMEFSGPVVSLQHVPLFDAQKCSCLYNYNNHTSIIAAMRESGVIATISGHYHAGISPVSCDGFTAVATPALCESPFRFQVIDIAPNGLMNMETQQLKCEDKRTLVDWHIHSCLGYCAENMDFDKTIELAELFGLNNFAISEHAGQLMMSYSDFGSGAYFDNSVKIINRTDAYLQEFLRYNERDFYCGLEIEFDSKGRPTVNPEIAEKLDVRLGAVHFVPNSGNCDQVTADFMRQIRIMLSFGVDTLVHPFRFFQHKGYPAPQKHFPEIIKMLRATNTAAEVNFHTYEPEYEFYRMCLESGVKLSLGTDSHNLCNIGEFYPHLKFLDKLGADNSDLLQL